MSSFSARNDESLVAGYISRQLLKGIYTSIPTLPEPSIHFRQVRALQRLVTSIGTDALLLAVNNSVQRSHRQRSPSDGDMWAVLNDLERHTRPLSDELDGLERSAFEEEIPKASIEMQALSLLASPPFQPFGVMDASVVALAQWFKTTYMSWVDPIPCPECHGKTRRAEGENAQPTDEERREGVSRVEIHECAEATGCSGRVRFPRYRSVRSLIRTRTGRCGEWAQLFYEFLRVSNIESRYVWNSEDHVWTEYWSPDAQHWMHVDPSEAAVSKPLLYARGWGKKQAFCIAVGPGGYEDVTRAYVDDYEGACQERRRTRGWRAALLQTTLSDRTIKLRGKLSEVEVVRLRSMDILQKRWMDDEKRRLQEAEQAELGGRLSGPEDWRKMRSELGDRRSKTPKYRISRHLLSACDMVNLLGNTRADPDSFTLTDAAGTSSAIFAEKRISQKSSFKCSLKFRMTEAPDSAAADGMAIVFCPEAKLGLGGFGMGYSGLGSEGDFAVEIDVYRTQDFAADPPTPHISLHSPPNAHHRYAVACTSDRSLPYLSNGQTHVLDLLYNGKTRTLLASLTLPHTQDKSSEEAEVLSLFDVSIPLGSEEYWLVGVTAACGGLWQKQEVLDFRVTEIEFHAK